MTPAEIEALTPAELMLRAMHTAAKNGDTLLAVNIAERAAPYYNAKVAAMSVDVRGNLTLEQLVLQATSRHEG